MADRKAIFISGGASGIGRAVATLFAAKGWRVGIGDVDAGAMAATADALGVETHALDVRDFDRWVAVLDAFTRGGPLHVLHNNAGIAVGGPFGEIGRAELDRVTDINFRGVLYGARAAFPHLARTPGSCLLNTASASAIWGAPGLAAYSATKFGVRGLTEALDGEWAAAGIRVRSLMPGFIDTPLLKANVGGSNATAREKVVEAGLEFTPVEDVAQKAWDLVHDEKALHAYIGPTARKLAFAARWLPGKLRKELKARSPA
jgi:NAD(P)-dependent dehydrogenase (short-subunit alcohol dehydrogenase family)